MSTVTIGEVMTSQPHSVNAKDTLQHAQQLMTVHRIRHLPVMSPRSSSQVMGMSSDRDLKAACGVPGINPAKIAVENVCHRNPYIVEADTPLSDVVSMMADRHYGSAIVVSQTKLVGIFTTVDACRVLTRLLRESR